MHTYLLIYLIGPFIGEIAAMSSNLGCESQKFFFALFQIPSFLKFLPSFGSFLLVQQIIITELFSRGTSLMQTVKNVSCSHCTKRSRVNNMSSSQCTKGNYALLHRTKYHSSCFPSSILCGHSTK